MHAQPSPHFPRQTATVLNDGKYIRDDWDAFRYWKNYRDLEPIKTSRAHLNKNTVHEDEININKWFSAVFLIHFGLKILTEAMPITMGSNVSNYFTRNVMCVCYASYSQLMNTYFNLAVCYCSEITNLNFDKYLMS